MMSFQVQELFFNLVLDEYMLELLYNEFWTR